MLTAEQVRDESDVFADPRIRRLPEVERA